MPSAVISVVTSLEDADTHRPCTVVIADDHPMFRDVLHTTVDSDRRFSVVAASSDGETLIRIWETHRPDLVVTDLSMGEVSGLDAVRAIRDIDPDARIVALSAHREPHVVVAAVTAGVCGYLSKALPGPELMAHLRNAAAGGTAFDQWATEVLMEHTRNPDTPIGLSERHVAVAKLIAEGFSREQIAETLHLSVSSVKDTTGDLYRRLGVTNAAAAVKRSIEIGIVEAGEPAL